jgi:oligopeptidase A
MRESSANPFLRIEHPIAFDRMSAEHVRPAVHVLLAAAQRELERMERDESPCTYQSVLRALEELTEPLGRAMNVIGHLESVATTPELRDAYNEIQPAVSAFFSSISLSEGLWKRLQAFAQTEEAKSLPPTQARFLKKTLESFEREGAQLDAAGKERLQAINVELSELTTKFGQNVLDSTNAFEVVLPDDSRLAGIPERARLAARDSAERKGLAGYRLTLQEPTLIPVLTYAEDASLREQLYRGHNTRATSGPYDNRGLVARILELRREKAQLLGFRDFVDLVVSDRMAKNGQRARTFLEDLDRRSRAAFESEKAELTAFRREVDGDPSATVSPWDVGYYAEKLRTRRYELDEEMLRAYFPLEGVLTGLFELVQRLYGIRVERADDMPVWHESVRGYRVSDHDGSTLGVFYADLFPRESKRGGAWMNAFVTGEPSAQGFTPHVGLICANVTPPVNGAPSLLSHREVETIFHEFGHLLHHLLSRVEVRSLSGTSVAWDFVELPSQIMENFCWERASLDLFARHHQTGEVIPEALFSRMRAARTYRGASAMMRQLGFGLVDLLLHMDFDPKAGQDVLEFCRSVMERFSPAPLPAEYAMITSFGHLFAHPVGYAGGYYSYKWAEVLDADAFSKFRGDGLFSPAVGAAFRHKVLARGDSRDPMELFVDFMGREPDLKPLLERSGITSAAA